MPTETRHAVVLAAGRGTRMGEMTEAVPKPMLLIDGRPMLEHILERLARAGIERFVVVIGYRGETIRQHFEGSKFDINFAVQDPVNGTGSAALLAQPFTRDEPFLLTFADVPCDPAEYTRAMRRMDSETECVLAVKRVEDPWQGAAVYTENGRITRIIEKPPRGTSTTPWNSAGFYCFHPSLYPYLQALRPSARHEYELTSAIEAMLADGRLLTVSEIEGDWRDVGRPEDLAAANSKPEPGS